VDVEDDRQLGRVLVSSKNASIALLAPGRQTWKRTPVGITPSSRRPLNVS
jgi:hypothetical protein